MTVEVNTAAEEFNEDGTPKPEVAPAAVVPKPGMSAEDATALKAQLSEALEEIEGLKGSTEIVERLREVFAGGQAAPVSKRDEYVRKEILRLLPELTDVGQLKKILPAVLTAMDATVEERIEEKAQDARGQVKLLMKGVGLDPDDAESAGYVEEAVTRAIKGDKALLTAWTRGDVLGAVKKGFDKVQAKLFATPRVGAKRDAVTSITTGPKATPKGGASPGAGAPAGKPKVDFNDTSRKGQTVVHDAAFDYLQELLSKE